MEINIGRLIGRLQQLGECGALNGGGVCRIALSEADKQGRDLVVSWMHELGLAVSVDQLGNVIATRDGTTHSQPILIGSHIDTVATGGNYDGNLGVLAGLEVIACLNEAGIQTERAIAVGFFTNEEGVRYTPDMMGSMTHQGHLDIQQMLDTIGFDGSHLGQQLKQIGYAGALECGSQRVHSYLELHIEQGPVLEQQGITIGVVEGVQGISWTQIEISGVSNHAGTTPMHLRHDAGYAAMAIATFVRELALQMGGDQVATVGSIELKPNLINVIANSASISVDLRNTDQQLLNLAEQQLASYIEQIAASEKVQISCKELVRFAPVGFDPQLVNLVEKTAQAQGHSVLRMPSGAGHDAQAFAPNCPTAMIFVPSVAGISHNIKEHTEPGDIEAGANVLLAVVLQLANS